MPTSTTVNDLKINTLTKAQYDTSTKSSTELWMVTDDFTYDVQTDNMPNASASYLGKIYQYTGATGVVYTNGYFYKCVSDGQSTPTYSWTQVSVQPAGSSLPPQAGNAGKFLTTDGTDASWGDALHLSGGTLTGNLEISTGSSITFPGTSTYSQSISNSGSTSLLFESTYSPSWGLFMDLGRSEIRGIYDGYGKLGSSNYHWGEGYINNLYTTKINNGSDITIPTAGGTMALTSDIPTVDQTYNASSTNPQSGTAVAGAISAAISNVYKAAGTVAFANKPSLSSSIEGYVYNISDAFTTTADFVEGAGNSYPAGTNIVCINTASSGQTAVYKWDVLAGFIDLSGYQPLLVSGTNIKTINSNSILGSGNITIDSLPSQTGQSGKYLTTNGTAASWATISTTLSGLTDVTITSATSGQVLSYNGTNWENSDPTPAMVIVDYTAA